MLKKIAEISCIAGAVGTWVGIAVVLLTNRSQDSASSADGPIPHFVQWLIGVGVLVSASSILTLFALLRGDYAGVGLHVESAKWYCTRVGTKSDVTSLVQGLVRADGLVVHAHDNVLGDICKGHAGTGDPKTLEVDLSYRLHLTATHDGWISVHGPQIGPPHQGPEPPTNEHVKKQELLTEIERLKRDQEREHHNAQGWIEEVKVKESELAIVTTKCAEQSELIGRQNRDLNQACSDLSEARKTLKAESGPEVFVGFNGKELTLENMSADREATKLTIDPFDTTNYSVAMRTPIVAFLGHGNRCLLDLYMVDNRKNIRFTNIDVKDLLIDSAEGTVCRLESVVRYTDSWGNRFRRRVSLEANQVEVHLDRIPQIVNHEIELDHENQSSEET